MIKEEKLDFIESKVIKNLIKEENMEDSEKCSNAGKFEASQSKIEAIFNSFQENFDGQNADGVISNIIKLTQYNKAPFYLSEESVSFLDSNLFIQKLSEFVFSSERECQIKVIDVILPLFGIEPFAQTFVSLNFHCFLIDFLKETNIGEEKKVFDSVMNIFNAIASYKGAISPLFDSDFIVFLNEITETDASIETIEKISFFYKTFFATIVGETISIQEQKFFKSCIDMFRHCSSVGSSLSLNRIIENLIDIFLFAMDDDVLSYSFITTDTHALLADALPHLQITSQIKGIRILNSLFNSKSPRPKYKSACDEVAHVYQDIDFIVSIIKAGDKNAYEQCIVFLYNLFKRNNELCNNAAITELPNLINANIDSCPGKLIEITIDIALIGYKSSQGVGRSLIWFSPKLVEMAIDYYLQDDVDEPIEDGIEPRYILKCVFEDSLEDSPIYELLAPYFTD